MSKALGRDINDFYNNHFPPNYFLDDNKDWIQDYQDENAILCLPENEKFELDDFGILVPDYDDNKTPIKFSTHFKRWLKQKKIVHIIIEVAKEDKADALAALKSQGFKIVN
jgi:hypothetical protein